MARGRVPFPTNPARSCLTWVRDRLELDNYHKPNARIDVKAFEFYH